MARLIASFMLAALFSTSIARAQNPEAREQAKQHYSRGLELSGDGHYARALEEFLAAYQSSPNFAVWYNIGQSYVALGRPSEAVVALQQYLTEGNDRISAERQAQTRAQIEAQKSLLAELSVVVDTPGSSIRLDGREVGHAPLPEVLQVTPGAHALSVVAPNRPEVFRNLMLRAGQQLELQIIVAPGVAAAGRAGSSIALERAAHAPPRPKPTTHGREASNRASTLGWVLGGLGVGLGAAAIGHYAWNRARYADWKDAHAKLSDPNATDRHQRQIDNNELAASIDRASRVTVTLALGCGALVATGTTLLVVNVGVPRDAHNDGMSVALQGVW